MIRAAASRIAAGLTGLAALTLIAAAPAAADDPAAESSYSAYQRAIHAAALCEERSFDQDAQERMSVVIDEKIHYDIGAGRRLTLIEQAKSEVGKTVDDKGCADPAVQDSLMLFRAELAPSLAQ